MSDFQYTGTNTGGGKVSGTLSAPDRKTAIRLLQQKGVVPIKVSEQGQDHKSAALGKESGTRVKGLKSSLSGLAKKDRQANNKFKASHAYGLRFAKRLLELHSGGMPVGDSIFLLSQRLSEERLKAIVSEVWRQLREGKSFAKATESIPNLFPAAMFPLFEAGDASGDMLAILKNTIEYIEDRSALKKRIIASISYPFVLISVVMLIMILFLKFLIPMIQNLIQSMGGEMNLITRIMIGFSEWMLSAAPIALILGVIGLLVYTQWRRTAKGRLLTDKWMLKVPLIGKIIGLSGQYQLSNLMGTLMESGINTSDNLRLCERTIQNQWIRSKFSTARTMIVEGASFSNAFRQNDLYPESSIDILTVGENTGHLERGLNEITKSVREMLDNKLKTLAVVISAGTMAFAFIMVAFTAIGMVTSILEVSQTISRF